MSKFFFSPSNIAAGFVAVLIGFSSSAAIVFQAATMAGATASEISSWLFALGLGLSGLCIGLSFYYRQPILMGWSTPGAALLATSLSGVSMPEAVGAFMFAAALTVIAGASGLFKKIIVHIPKSLTSAMLAGILFHFGMNAFDAMQRQSFLVFSMMLAYLIGKRFFSRYVIIFVLCVGVLNAYAQGLFHIESVHFSFSTPIFTAPQFSLATLISVGIPLFVVTMTSQNVPGITVLNSAGYSPAISPIISWSGIVTLLLAPFGCYSLSIAAMTAAICCSPECDANPANRYKACLISGLCWLCIGLLGATVVTLLFSFPREFIIALAGLGVLSTITNSMTVALQNETEREPALITILVAASGLSLFGVGSAFWSLLAGILASTFLNWKKREIVAVGTSAA